jgi:type I restriction enzyme, S subunit
MKKVPKGWAEAKLSDVGEIVAGGTPSTKNEKYFDGKIPWLTPADLSGYTEKFISRGRRYISEAGLKASSAKLMPSGSILFSSRAPIGYVVISRVAVSTNQGFKNLIPSKFIFNEYAYYYLKSAKRLAENMASGTTFKEISGSKFAELPIPLPPLPEQHRIVAKIEELFSDLDAGIESLRKVKDQLKTYRQSVLKWAFEGKLTEEWRKTSEPQIAADYTDFADKTRKFSNISSAQSSTSAKISGSDNLPEGWKWMNVAEVLICTPTNGRSVPTRQGGFKVLRLTALGGKYVDISENKEGAWTEAEAEPFLLRQNDFLVCRGNGSLHLVGRGSLVATGCKMAYPDTLIRLRLSSEIEPSFLYYVWASGIVREQIEATARTTAGIYKINQKDICKIEVPIAPLSEQSLIVSEIESRLSVADNLEKTINASLAQADALRQSILKRAFEGKLIPQNPNDEPAEKLLERIKNVRTADSRRLNDSADKKNEKKKMHL